MTEKIEKQLEQIINAQNTSVETNRIILNEVEALKKSFERLHLRFDEIHEKTIIYGQKLIVLNDCLEKNEKKYNEQNELIWKKMRESKYDAISTAKKDIKLWLFTAILGGFGSLIFVIVTNFIKIK